MLSADEAIGYVEQVLRNLRIPGFETDNARLSVLHNVIYKGKKCICITLHMKIAGRDIRAYINMDNNEIIDVPHGNTLGQLSTGREKED